MLLLNKFSVLITVLLIAVLDVKVVLLTDPPRNDSYVSNGTSMVLVKGAYTTDGKGNCYCSCPNTAKAGASGCFASDTLVTLANRKRIPIHSLRSGDQLLTTNGLSIFTTQMMMMLDKNSFSQALFHTIVTASEHNVSLTPLHLIPIVQGNKELNYIPAKQVKVGDLVYVMSDDGMMMMPSPVREVIVETKAGYYAPLSTSGTILANGIMAGCYSNVQSHEAAQWYMGPLRWYYWLAQSLSINEPFGHQNIEDIHFIPKIMYEFARFFRPTTLLVI